VLIAAGGHASVFEAQANHPDLTPVEEMTFSANLPANRDILTIRVSGPCATCQIVLVRPAGELKRAFAKKLGAVLKVELAVKRFDHLVIVAPPSTLGDLRKIATQKHPEQGDGRAGTGPRQDSAK
jgi:protein required for attachment to host cells